MKHFFDQETTLDDLAKTEILEAARRELKQTQMNLNEMSTHMNLVCFNASTANEYIPRGMEGLITTHIFPVNSKNKQTFKTDFAKFLLDVPGEVLGYVFENIQEKEQKEFLDIAFKLKTDFFFDPFITTHFSYSDLIEYLADFLKSAAIDDTNRKIEVYEDNSSKPWKTIIKAAELNDVDTEIKTPVVLNKPFFNDISVSIIKQGKEKKIQSSFGKLKSIQPNFNKSRTLKGELIRSQNKVFLKIKDILDFKLATSHAKTLMGVSYKGEFISATKFITHDIALKPIKLSDLDFFRIKHDRKTIELKPDEIAGIEINLDTQQTVIQRKVSKSENHVARFNRLKLFRNDVSVVIHKTIAFNRGESNFEQIQTFFGTRYTECEKARNILTERGEFGLLGTRSIASGDITSHLVLANMKLLRFLPFDTQCVGINPDDLQNFSKTNQLFTQWYQELKATFQNIIDVSETPNFTEHNFTRLTKNIQKFLKIKSIDDVSNEIFEDLINELERLIEYMDDFFKLNVYSELQENLETDTPTGIVEGPIESEELVVESENIRLDDETKDFLTENYAFFNKRSLVQTALIRIERMLFFNKNIKPYIENSAYHPDLIIYKDTSSKKTNFRSVCYPAMALDTILNKSVLNHSDHEDELFFVKFMREFTRRTHQKALELNKSFHHQFKHTLAELTYIADEKLNQLTDELQFLEKPENKEAAYKQLLEKITALYHQHLDEKRENIDQLIKEKEAVTNRYTRFKSDLEKLIGQEIAEDQIGEYLKNAPNELEKIKAEILTEHKALLAQTSPVLNAYIKLHASSIQYFNKILKYASLFLKALWVHHNRKTFQIVKQESAEFIKLDETALSGKIAELESKTYDKTKESIAYKEIGLLSQKLKQALIALSKIPVRGLYQSQNKPSSNLDMFLSYYEAETGKLLGFIKQIQPVYQTLSQYQNQLFKKQEEYVFSRLEKAKDDLRLKVLKLIQQNPECEAEIDALEKTSEKVPNEIKDELGTLRASLVKSVTAFKEKTTPDILQRISDYSSLRSRMGFRDQLNEITKELVNYKQGLQGLQLELDGENDDLKYLESQEPNLENIAMSKALPSTRILIKTQYVPLVEREKSILNKANQFLSEIISKETEIRDGLISAFFTNRYGHTQFLEGAYCMDVSKSTKDHTERNINSAYMLISERFVQCCAAAAGEAKNISMKKLEIQGLETLRNRISQVWHGHVNDRFIYLPSTFTLEDTLELCEYKDLITQNNPKPGKTKHSLILIYVNRIRFDEVSTNKALKERYNNAILSNIFINIDGVNIFNNRESIYEACIRETFGNCTDQIASDIAQKFLYG